MDLHPCGFWIEHSNHININKKDMIKNYKLFTEGILDKLKGPSYDEVLKNTSPDKLLRTCFINLDDFGVEYSLERGADKELYNKLVEMKDWFLDVITELEEYTSDEYSESIFYVKDGVVLIEEENKRIYLDYDKIFSVFILKYDYSYSDILSFIKNMLEKYLNFQDVIIIGAISKYPNLILNKRYD